jgi:glutathionyl-hydroquinone reductase
MVEPSQKTLAILFEKLEVLEHFLTERKWIAGDFMTVADFSICATFSAIYVSSIFQFFYPN